MRRKHQIPPSLGAEGDERGGLPIPDFLKKKTQEARSAGQVLPLRFSCLKGQFFAVSNFFEIFSKRQIFGKRQLTMGSKLMGWVSSKPCRSPTKTHALR